MTTNVDPSFDGAVAAANQDLEQQVFVKKESDEDVVMVVVANEENPNDDTPSAVLVAVETETQTETATATDVDKLVHQVADAEPPPPLALDPPAVAPQQQQQQPPSQASDPPAVTQHSVSVLPDAPPHPPPPPVDADSSTITTSAAKAVVVEEDLGDPIDVVAPMDVLSGRGASVNNHPGNKKFRALCFVRKPLFDAGNHAAKRRIATEIVNLMMKPPPDANVEPSRFLKRKDDKGPHYAMTEEQAIAKAQQVMRDYKRPDRVSLRENLEASGQLRKRNRTTVSTPIDEVSRRKSTNKFVYMYIYMLPIA
jgi:hypothetical protein